MKIKIHDSIASVNWSLQRGQIVDAANYPDAKTWIKNGTATIVEEEVETADLPANRSKETATIKTKIKK